MFPHCEHCRAQGASAAQQCEAGFMKKRHALIATAALALSLSACGSDGDTTAPTPPSQAPATSAESTTPAPGQTSEDSSEEANENSNETASQLPAEANTAIDTVLAAHRGTLIGLDQKDDGWKVKVLNEDTGEKVDVRTDKTGAEIVKVEWEGQAHPNDVERAKTIQVGLLEAIDQVMGEYPGEFDEADLDNDGDEVYWEIEINNAINGEDAKVKVRVTDGEMRLAD